MSTPAANGQAAEPLDLSEMPEGGIFGAFAMDGATLRAQARDSARRERGEPLPDDDAAPKSARGRGKKNGAAPADASGPLGVCLADVEAEAIRWAWPGWLALGKLHVFDGNPGMGKSTLLCDLAASVTTGSAWPDGRPVPTAARGAVMILTAEDDPATTIRPRMEAAAADVNLVVVVSTIPTVPTAANPTGAGRLPTLPADVPLLLAECVRLGVRLLIIDPVTAYLGDVNSHRDSDVRGALAPLAAAAEEAGVAVVLVRHLNKGIGGDAMMRGGGSIAFAGLARVVWLVGTDPNDADARALAVSKNNLAAFPESIGYALESAGPFGVGRVVWRGPVGLTANDLVRPAAEPSAAPAQAAAEEFLLEALADGPRAAVGLIDEADAAGIKKRTLWRAKTKLGIEVERRGFGKDGASYWLPPAGPPSSATVPTAETVAQDEATRTRPAQRNGREEAETSNCATASADYGEWHSMDDVARYGEAEADGVAQSGTDAPDLF